MIDWNGQEKSHLSRSLRQSGRASWGAAWRALGTNKAPKPATNFIRLYADRAAFLGAGGRGGPTF